MKPNDLKRSAVTVAICGAEPERALNALTKNGVEFHNALHKDDFRIELTVAASDYPAACELNGKFDCEVVLLSESGRKELAKSAKRRGALLLTLFLCALLLTASSLFVWNIEVVGNESITKGELLRALSDAGLSEGCFLPSLDTDTVKNRVLGANGNISWLAINLHGSRAEVVIHERTGKPEILKESEPQSIYAAKSGVITELAVFEGTALVKKGDTVTQGDILVSGEMLSETAEARYVRAYASVKARTWYELSCVTPLYEYAKVSKSVPKTRLSAFAWKNRINFCSDSRNYDASCDKINKIIMPSFGPYFVLPFGLSLDTTTECETRYREIDVDSAIERLSKHLNDELKERIGDGDVINTVCTVSRGNGLLYVTLRAECIENIAVSGEL